jgi:hypothetical protein
MQKNRVAKSLAVAAQWMFLMAAPGLAPAQSPAPLMVQPSASSPAAADPYAAAFSGLTYTDKQKEAIGKIKEDYNSRKAIVQKSDKLDQDQKDAMLTGYTRLEYREIYKVLTPEQQKEVSLRMHADHPSGSPAPSAHAHAR